MHLKIVWFEDCVALTEVDLSKTALQEISSDAFRETGLKKVTLPASLKKIGSQAFLGTTSGRGCIFCRITGDR